MPKQTSPAGREFYVDEPNQKARRPPSSPLRSITIILLLLSLGLFAYSMVADRLTPFKHARHCRQQGYVNSFVFDR